jgi:hypothetical protein
MATLTITSGVTSSGLAVSSGEDVIVLSGAVLGSSTVDSGGAVTLSSGGVASAVVVLAGGALSGQGAFVGSGLAAGDVSGIALGGALLNPGTIELQSGGMAVGLATGKGELVVDAGAEATDTRLSSFLAAGGAYSEIGSTVVFGLAIDTDIGLSATQTVRSGGVSQDALWPARLPATPIQFRLTACSARTFRSAALAERRPPQPLSFRAA